GRLIPEAFQAIQEAALLLRTRFGQLQPGSQEHSNDCPLLEETIVQAKDRLDIGIGKAVAQLTFLAVKTAWAQDAYPKRTLEVVVPWTAGQATDIAARTFVEELSTKLGQTFFISNKAGAGGAVGSAYVARANNDGYTLLAASTGSVIVSPLLNETSYAASDFVPAALIAKSPSILITAADFPAKNINELIKLLKDNPG